MGLFDKLTGSRAGNPGVAPVPTAELRSALALLALGNGDWQVRDGADHHCDLVDAAADLLVGEVAEPALDLVDPGLSRSG